jgi:hypothetical protein
MNSLFPILILASVLLGLVFLIIVFVKESKATVHRLSNFFSDTPVEGRSNGDDGQMIKSMLGQRAVGMIVTVICGYLMYHIWHEALLGNSYDLIYGFIAPVMTMLGLDLALFPIDTDEQLRKHGSEKPRNWNETPMSMKVMLVFGICAGFGNCYALHRLG